MQLDMTKVELDDEGEATEESLQAFIEAMPRGERLGMTTSSGWPMLEAFKRFHAALFERAYGSQLLSEARLEAPTEWGRGLLEGLDRAAPALARLELLGSGGLDIRCIVAEAAERAYCAAAGGTLPEEADQEALFTIDEAGRTIPGPGRRDTAVEAIVRMMAENNRSPGAIAERLIGLARAMMAEDLKAGACERELPGLARPDRMTERSRAIWAARGGAALSRLFAGEPADWSCFRI